MSAILLEAQSRTDMGKGASRRLRRLENKVPAIIYGGDKEPKPIHFLHNKVMKALETESIYSSVFDISVDGKTTEKVILKTLQRHPYKPIILHMDLQRVSAKDVLVKWIPIHFINEDLAPGVKAGGLISHTMTQVEVRCQVKDLPQFIEVDLATLEMNGIMHLSQLKLPKGVHLAIEIQGTQNDAPVVSIHPPKVSAVEEETPVSTTEQPEPSQADEDQSSE